MKVMMHADSTEKARQVAAWAAGLARRTPLEATVLTTRQPPTAELAAAGILHEELSAAAGIEVKVVRVETDLPEEAIGSEAAASDVGLVIVGPSGRRGVARLVHGAMEAKVIQDVAASVLIVRRESFPPRRVLACVSGSRHSLTNVRAAAHLSLCFGATVSILTVLSQLPVEFSQGEQGGREDFLKSDHPLAVHLRTAEDLLRSLGAKGGVRVREGLVVDEILDELEAFGHDVLVLGTHRAEDYDPMYEDLTSELVARSDRTVLVVGARAEIL